MVRGRRSRARDPAHHPPAARATARWASSAPTASVGSSGPAPACSTTRRELDSARLDRALRDVPVTVTFQHGVDNVRGRSHRAAGRLRRAAAARHRRPDRGDGQRQRSSCRRSPRSSPRSPRPASCCARCAARPSEAGWASLPRGAPRDWLDYSTIQVPFERSSDGEVARALALRGRHQLAARPRWCTRGARRRGTRRSASAGGRCRPAGPGRRPGSGPGGARRGRGWRPRRRRPRRRSRSWPSGRITTPFSTIGAEADRLAVLEGDEHVGPHLLAGDGLEGAVVEDVAVLEDLDERRALVVVGGPEGLDHVLAVEVVGAGHERGLGAERHRRAG